VTIVSIIIIDIEEVRDIMILIKMMIELKTIMRIIVEKGRKILILII
jgi:hypothetical protein